MAFNPSVLPVLAGTTVNFVNNDGHPHNVYSLSVARPFDLGIADPGDKASVTFSKEGLVKLYCNIHRKMIGYVLVLGNPFFSQGADDGTFEIKNIPSGVYEFIAWYRYGEIAKKDVVLDSRLEPGQTRETNVRIRINLDLIKTHEDPLHRNKWGKDYSGKY
jgi:hypothetical protein